MKNFALKLLLFLRPQLLPRTFPFLLFLLTFFPPLSTPSSSIFLFNPIGASIQFLPPNFGQTSLKKKKTCPVNIPMMWGVAEEAATYAVATS